MSEHKSHRIKVANLPKSKAMCTVNNKSIGTLLIVWMIAIIIMLTAENKILAIPFVFYGFIISFRSQRNIFSGHNSFFVIYDNEKNDECDIYYLSELKSWMSDGSFFNPSITFVLNDDQKVVLSKAVDGEIAAYLHKVAEKKEIKKKK